ncbi:MULTISPECIES: hypothetical protein [unclassified Xanthobacter]|uniref:hypothetical protein n=1 Tax=unclassified Xanthobacter TaxID=2623496 RepID=UPI001EDD0435|nr:MULTISPECIES: hypothetical protein [unclassified Xanthobacter]
MIEQIMYFALGALVATFVALLVLPAVWHRAVRLTTRRVEAAVPVSIFEIQADKDQQRAFFALNQRRLELQADAMRETIAGHAATIEHQRQRVAQLEAALSDLQRQRQQLEGTLAEQSVLLGEVQDQLADAQSAQIPETPPLAPRPGEERELQEAAIALSIAPLRAEQERLQAAVLAAAPAKTPPAHLKTELKDVAARLTAMVARMEGVASPIPALVADAQSDDHESLAARIRDQLTPEAETEPAAPLAASA